jgi:hypothetical protein
LYSVRIWTGTLAILRLFIVFFSSSGKIPKSYINYYYLIQLQFGGSGTTIGHNTQILIPYKITHTLKQNTAHKATKTIKDTLYTINIINKKSEAILVTGLGKDDPTLSRQ